MREHERWFEIAQRDIKDARILYQAGSYPSAAYLCQQATEKALKSYLIHQQHEIVKTHDLIKLKDLCKNFDADFQRLHEALKMLNPFATKFRYPSEFDIPDQVETKLAINQAQTVIDYVLKKISEAATGQLKIQ